MRLHKRHLVAGLAAGLVAIATLAIIQPADAASTRVTPGSFTGYAFDAYTAPSQEEMDVWLERSPYWGIGIYTSGGNRFDEVQPNLTPEWVEEQDDNGWKLLPIHVGLQASCSNPDREWDRIDPDPADDYAAARAQGRDEAVDAVAAAQGYGIAKRSTIWYDLEHFDIGKTHCRESALSLVSAWTRRLHELGYRSGFYSSASSGITMLDDARADSTDSYTLPDQIWIGHYVKSHQDPGPYCELKWGTTSTSYISDDGWRGQRMRQFCGSHDETYGGVTINIDTNYLEIGGGSRAPKASPHCKVAVDFSTYPKLERGDRKPQVAAAECFLRQQGFFGRKVDRRFDRATARAVRRFQRACDSLTVTGTVDGRTWTALLSSGSTPLMKHGSASNAVRRLQRTLNAADRTKLDVDGVFDKHTRKATVAYQRDHDLPGSGVVTDEMWDLLQRGRR
jgi:peptidoglycan hydrolase-like protein with peptidoglycan-binding domain